MAYHLKGSTTTPRRRDNPVVFVVPAALFMAGAFLLPLLMVLYTSVGGNALTLAHYAELVSRPLYAIVLWNTLQISAFSTLATVLVAYPIAYHLARQPPRRRALLLILVLLPFWTSILVKSFAFTVLLGQDGALNQIVTALFGDGARIKLLFNRPAVLIGMTHYLVPFAVFSILASLLAQDPDLRRAAEIMGAGRWRIFLAITLPLSMPGVLASALLSMILSMGMFVTPALLGGRADLMISNLVDFHVRETLDWGAASALAACLIVVTGIFAVLLSRIRPGQLLGREI
ncbi:MAG TPA: ABC transporter permease [Stellaceae bacterium]|nr:ABC transporter permease [Stellaceae bacterium]